LSTFRGSNRPTASRSRFPASVAAPAGGSLAFLIFQIDSNNKFGGVSVANNRFVSASMVTFSYDQRQEHLMAFRAKSLRLALCVLLGAAFPIHAADKDTPLPDAPIGKAPLLVSEDFESTAVGQIPSAFTKTGMVAVVDDVSHSGKHSLRLDAVPHGARRITLKGDVLKALAGEHWGRLYFKVQLPTPVPDGATPKTKVIHSTIVAGSAQSPLAKDPIEVRVLDTIEKPDGSQSYIYNVQPKSRPEFARGSPSKYRYSDEWTLAEWHVDSATQTYRAFINGEEVKGASFSNGAGNFEKSEIPEVFESLSFGWWSYQAAGPGFVAWIDDIALSKERIGDRGLPHAK
jgi:hypothetical protein